MSRSVFGTVCLEPIGIVLKKTSDVLIQNGFREIENDFESAWVKENSETSYATYVKLEFLQDVFVFSVWLRNMSDESKDEICVEVFNSTTSKDARNITSNLLDLFNNKFRKIESYVYEV